MSEPIRPAESTPDAGTGPDTIALERRAVLRVAGVAGMVGVVGAGLAACSSSNNTSASGAADTTTTSAAAPSDTSMASAGASASSSGGSGGGSGTALGSASEVPVGGGMIFASQMVVVTQPTAGTYKAFGTTCTHAGCQVNKVSGGTIDCPCHGSKYSITDGSVQAGPAPQPLAAKNVTVQGGQIILNS